MENGQLTPLVRSTKTTQKETLQIRLERRLEIYNTITDTHQGCRGASTHSPYQ